MTIDNGMSQIKTIIFDLGGVIITLDPQQAVNRFKALGLADAEERLDSSVRRILEMKEKHGILDLNVSAQEMTDEEILAAAETVGSPENHEVEWQLTQKAVTLVKNDNDLLPIKAEPGEHILVLYTAGSRIAAAE